MLKMSGISAPYILGGDTDFIFLWHRQQGEKVVDSLHSEQMCCWSDTGFSIAVTSQVTVSQSPATNECIPNTCWVIEWNALCSTQRMAASVMEAKSVTGRWSGLYTIYLSENNQGWKEELILSTSLKCESNYNTIISHRYHR